MNIKPFGKHLIIDAKDAKGELKDRNHIQNFINELVLKLGMEKKGDTIFEYFEDNEFNRHRDIVGWSVVQIISLSSIVIHINEISKTIYLDVFTCGNLNDLMVICLFSEYFKVSTMKKKIIIRDTKNI